MALDQAHLVAVHALEGHELGSEVVAVHGLLGPVAGGAGQQAVAAAGLAGVGAGHGLVRFEQLPQLAGLVHPLHGLGVPDVLALDVQLWHPHLTALHPLAHLRLVLHAHEDVPLLKLDQQGAQDLLDVGTLRVGFPDDAHAGGVQHHLAQVFLLEVLRGGRNGSGKADHRLVRVLVWRSARTEMMKSRPPKTGNWPAIRHRVRISKSAMARQEWQCQIGSLPAEDEGQPQTKAMRKSCAGMA